MTAGWARALLVLFAAAASLSVRAGPGATLEANDDQLWQYRNLGKAFYENPTTQREAVEQFRKALELAPESARERVNYGLALVRAGRTDEGIAELEKVRQQDPSLPHTWFSLGIQYKRRSTPESNALAVAQFEKMIALVPDEPISHYNLAYLYKVAGRTADALKHFEIAARLDPNLAGPRFQLYNAYRDPRVGRLEDAARELAAFQAIKKRQAGAVIPEDLEWSFFSEIYDPIDAAAAGPDPAPVTPSFRERDVLRGLDARSARLLVLNADGDDRPDLLAWSASGARLLIGGETAVAVSGLDELTGVTSIAPGDYDNDGSTDLAVATASGVSLWRNTGGRFAAVAGPLPSAAFTRAFWLDYDHDYDLDLLLFGRRNVLLRNGGEAGFTDATSDFPFVAGVATDAVAFEAVADTIGHDVVVSYADRPGVLYRDRLAGKYEAVPIETLASGSRALVALDFNRDSWMDIAAAGPSSSLLLLNAAGRPSSTAVPAAAAAPIVAADFENLGVADLVAGNRILRWTPDGIRDAPVGIAGAAARATADFNGDGMLDLVSIDDAGTVRLALNAGANTRAWLRVGLIGVKNLKGATGAEVEVKAGSRYQKAIYTGVPVHFGLGAHDTVDTIRITWPNGLIQNEARQAVRRAAAFKEAPRLSGSCPMIFTWDGRKFRFITDVLGVAPLGASAGDGEYFPVDHDEYVHVPGDAVAVAAGKYEVRVTEELREVSYLDRIHLIALDYPSSITVVTNDKFKAPPFPEFRLFGVDRPIAPVAAHDMQGRDVLDRVVALDRRYVDGYRRDFEGVAERHDLDLDFGAAAPDNRAVLILTGWVDWADGSTFRGAAQELSGGLMLPSLQVKDGQGRWQTVVEDMGIPAGKSKTIAVDLTGKFLSSSREVRISTNLCVYWDRIYLSQRTEPPSVVLTPVPLASADLRFHGFSRPIVDPQRKQPEAFEYHEVTPTSMWNPTPGLYTRYGDVAPLLAQSDDRLVIIGSGDEVRLRFDPRELPPMRDGWRRDFLLLFDGWAKDADANTAFSQTVEPLPFHAMSGYPYGAQQRFPHSEYAREYNTRPALRLIRTLAPRERRR